MNISDKDVTIHQQYLNARDHVKKLLKICKNEILKIEYCGDCYKNRVEPNYFTLVCSKPYPLLWAKFDKYPYWPAKLISVIENHLYVQFSVTTRPKIFRTINATCIPKKIQINGVPLRRRINFKNLST